MQGSLAASHWQERERLLTEACEHVAVMHNRLGVTEPVDPTARRYYGRPFHTLLKLRTDNPESSSAELAAAYTGMTGKVVDATWIRVNLHRARDLLGEQQANGVDGGPDGRGDEASGPFGHVLA